MQPSTLLRAGLAFAAIATSTSLYTAASAAAPSPRPVTQAPPCANGQVDSWLNTNGNGALGTSYYELQFTNLSSRACSLYGFPGVSAVDFAHHQVGGAAGRNGPKRYVVLAGGATARATLGIVETGNFSAGTCKPVEAFGLRVYAPNQTASDVIPWPFSVCSRATTVSMNIGSVTR